MLIQQCNSRLKRLIALFMIALQLSIFGCGQNEKPKSDTEDEIVPDSVERELGDTTLMQQNTYVYDYDTTQWHELGLNDEILLELRYASERNFVNEKLYDCPRCFLRPEVAKALRKAKSYFSNKGYKLKLFDCYRPRQVQEKLWEKVPNASYVTPPAKGSMHNRGTAVDLTLTDLANKEIDMGTDFDFFGPRAHHTYQKLPENILNNRKLLKEGMAKFGFIAIRTEWWHYSYRSKPFPLDTMQWFCEH